MRIFGRDKRIIADGIYGAASESDIISIENEFNSRDIAEFKERACARHEKYNGMIHLFKCLEENFGMAFPSTKNALKLVALWLVFNLIMAASLCLILTLPPRQQQNS
ncbi:unknown protein [Seminavis robusta]|uniref:Uncharacterized protein n=1 Tax=Seminavis robusta TaxID=568900 RepID=A0A9N8F1M6_9STRA|nr:unknown protein [Seminavis robusta]|eukprot:Sro2659_g333930.1 n/a (107) ;mRNA; r:8946-9266